MEKFIGGCVVLHEQKCRVIARERADKGLYVHAVKRSARGGGQSGKGLDDDDVLCLGIGRYTFTENLFPENYTLLADTGIRSFYETAFAKLTDRL